MSFLTTPESRVALCAAAELLVDTSFWIVWPWSDVLLFSVFVVTFWVLVVALFTCTFLFESCKVLELVCELLFWDSLLFTEDWEVSTFVVLTTVVELVFWVFKVSAFTLLELTAVPAPKESNAIPEAM